MTRTRCNDCGHSSEGLFSLKCVKCNSSNVDAEYRPDANFIKGNENGKRFSKSKRQGRSDIR